MARVVREAIEAGALGFSTSRTLGHRAMDGEPVPGTFAAEDELFGIGREMAKAGRAVFELAPMGAGGEDIVAPMKEVDWMRRLSAETGLPVSYALLQIDKAPGLWRELMDESLRAYDEGSQLYPQVAGRPFGMLIGFQTHHAFSKRPTFREVAARSGSIEELTAQLREPKVRARILAEDDLPAEPVLFDGLNKLIQVATDRLYKLGSPPDYEPDQSRTVASMAVANGVGTLEMLYDLFCEEDGRALLMLPMLNYSDGSLDAVHDMLTHPAGVMGLSDGGAHCGMICDASIPTFMLTHWTRDRTRGPKLPLEWVIRKQTHDTAQLFGLGDRGTLEVGKKADVNVIDHANLQLLQARMAFDLPAGGRRLLQEARGYKATIVSGMVTRRDGVDTGARPGQLLRGVR
jgi:N-acyl-D-amino-acid deacylase